MEIVCPTCQQKLQIADAHAGQMVKCPTCAAAFQAPSLPGAAPLTMPAAPDADVRKPDAPFAFAPDSAPPPPPIAPETPAQPESPTPPRPPGEYTRTCAIHVRQHVVTLIPPIGLVVLFLMTFFPWLISGLGAVPGLAFVRENAWGLAFSGSYPMLLFFILLLIVAAPIAVVAVLFSKSILPVPAALRPYLSWGPAVVAILTFASWFFFMTHYLHGLFMEGPDPATIWIKLAFRIHTLVLLAAVLDIWLQNRQRHGLSEPRLEMRW
jgi:hypothetical protein